MVEPALPVQHAARRERLADTHLSQLIEANTEVVELVDTHVSGACVARHEGSSPSFGTFLYFFDRFHDSILKNVTVLLRILVSDQQVIFLP